eukprot:GHUV01048682.1.p1 GENE.GHUV01048682.1~~GHUV01048682.1.p1  ORF type:complete len:121 (-),score=19.20 GHUV01048682.1:101-463(-)
MWHVPLQGCLQRLYIFKLLFSLLVIWVTQFCTHTELAQFHSCTVQSPTLRRALNLGLSQTRSYSPTRINQTHSTAVDVVFHCITVQSKLRLAQLLQFEAGLTAALKKAKTQGCKASFCSL